MQFENSVKQSILAAKNNLFSTPGIVLLFSLR